MLDCSQDTFVFALLTWFPPHTHHLNQISLSWSHQATGHGSSNPCPSSACLQQTVCGLFLCIIFRRSFFLGWKPCGPIWCSVWRMVWALTGWPPTPSILCSNVGSTLWSTMARPVLSGTCPVKLLYGLGHRAAAQFQGLGNLLIAYAIFK